MGAATVRAAVVKYFTGTPGLSTLSQDEPWFTPGQAWDNNGIPGTAGFVHIDHQSESWVTVGGPLGQRAVTYDIALVVNYQYTIPANAVNGDEYVAGLDALLDNLTEKLRADPSLGCGSNGPIWQAGISDLDITIQREFAVRDPNGGKIWSVNYVMFKATEIIGGFG